MLINKTTFPLDNWARELEFWCPALCVLQYHGTQEERRGIRIDIMNDNLEETPDVILTTYVFSCQNVYVNGVLEDEVKILFVNQGDFKI